jgi:hypothetical protein
MKNLPVEVTDEGVRIPIEYLAQADEFEAKKQNGYIVVRPKSEPPNESPEKKSWLHDLIGIAESKDPTASERAEEILMAEVTRRSGWTTKPSIDDVE